LRVALRKPDGSPVNPDIPTREYSMNDCMSTPVVIHWRQARQERRACLASRTTTPLLPCTSMSTAVEWQLAACWDGGARGASWSSDVAAACVERIGQERLPNQVLGYCVRYMVWAVRIVTGRLLVGS
jgi:hypothetical protein